LSDVFPDLPVAQPDAGALDRFAVRAQGGDQEAFAALVEASERDLRVFITLYATNLAMVDEITQSTYVTAFQNLARYQPRGTLRAWLKGIARNLLRRDLDERARLQVVAGERLESALAAVNRRQLDEEADAEDEGRIAQLNACLRQLAPEAQRLVRERYYEDRPIDEIARLLARSQSWVAVTLFRIRKTLLVCIRQKGRA
jgi:RNA polymerase sigma-70 factor (ECF subfamily)